MSVTALVCKYTVTRDSGVVSDSIHIYSDTWQWCCQWQYSHILWHVTVVLSVTVCTYTRTGDSRIVSDSMHIYWEDDSGVVSDSMPIHWEDDSRIVSDIVHIYWEGDSRIVSDSMYIYWEDDSRIVSDSMHTHWNRWQSYCQWQYAHILEWVTVVLLVTVCTYTVTRDSRVVSDSMHIHWDKWQSYCQWEYAYILWHVTVVFPVTVWTYSCHVTVAVSVAVCIYAVSRDRKVHPTHSFSQFYTAFISLFETCGWTLFN